MCERYENTRFHHRLSYVYKDVIYVKMYRLIKSAPNLCISSRHSSCDSLPHVFVECKYMHHIFKPDTETTSKNREIN